MSRIIQFEYKRTLREALEIGADDRMIGCLFCFQVTKDGEPSVGHKSFKVAEMMDVVEIDRKPFEETLQDIDETGFMGERGGGYGPCQGTREDKGGEVCGLFDDLNVDYYCPGCEWAIV